MQGGRSPSPGSGPDRLPLPQEPPHGGVEAIWLDEARRSDPRGRPNALYVNRGETYARTLLYDTARAVFLEISWGDWLEAEELRRAKPRHGRRRRR